LWALGHWVRVLALFVQEMRIWRMQRKMVLRWTIQNGDELNE
jgi:hypothetical protein